MNSFTLLKYILRFVLTLSLTVLLCSCTYPNTAGTEGTNDTSDSELSAAETNNTMHYWEETSIPTESESPTAESSTPKTESHNHKYSVAKTVAPKCGSKGYTLYKCSCGDSYKADYKAALKHNYSSKVVEPTWTEKGYAQHTCTYCGHTYKDDYSDSLEVQSQVRPYTPPNKEELASAIIKYINEYRNKEGAAKAQKLAGLTKIAQDRADQLVTKFEHDGVKLRALCNQYQYGKYVDATEFGADASDSYYTFGGAEAIARGPIQDTADNLGKTIATGFYESKGHWRYVGSGDNLYIAVGITYDTARNTFYCCVCLCKENYG